MPDDPKVHRDTALAVGSARTLGLVLTDGWPMVAALLLADGADGQAMAELAGLSAKASGWEVDQLLDAALAEAGVPLVGPEEAGVVAARFLAQTFHRTRPTPDHPIIRALASRGPSLDYPAGVIGRSYYASEWLDCACHRVSPERVAADELEAELENLPALDIDDQLATALSLAAFGAR